MKQVQIQKLIGSSFLRKEYIDDGFGNKFNSDVELCVFYNMTIGSYHNSLFEGKSIKDSILCNKNNANDFVDIVYDHKGNKYPTMTDMCISYNHVLSTLYSRLRLGWSLKDALESPIQYNLSGIECRDCNGNVFKSRAELCRYWGVNSNRLYYALKQGYTTEQFTAELDNITPNSKNWLAKFKIEYPDTYKDILKNSQVNFRTIRKRIRENWDIIDAITTPPVVGSTCSLKNIYVDHNGKEFSNLCKLCKEHHISLKIVKEKLSQGMNLREILISELSKRTDHKGITYTTVYEMCSAYNISYTSFKYRIEYLKLTTEEALEYNKICMHKNKRIKIPTKESAQWKQDLFELCNRNMFQYICIYKHMQVSEHSIVIRLKKNMSILDAIMLPPVK